MILIKRVLAFSRRLHARIRKTWYIHKMRCFLIFFFQAEDGIRDHCVTGVQTCALPICLDVFDTADSTTRELPVPRPPNGGASWSPDGKELAFLASNGQVWIASADGSGARQVTYTLIGPHGLDERPAWSPDGKKIAWTQNADLCVTDLAGAVRRLTYTPQSSDSVLASLPAWQPIAVGTVEPVAAAAVTNARQSCDWNPGVRVELLPDGVTPRDV